ncbi:hypothetical protein TGMAS_289260A [Toxoplasma gondii MAS]|uniref:Uncharacterized protein n=1 Tax=Toxoplasma gondii MAS TaxID=943118 RepID=A0A086QH65_TOXGO|nr:hypothetical protein TGMAS_289260A [Toxoplasma gondii MAS]
MKTFASSLDTLQGLCPTASDPDATGLPSAPDSEAQLQRRTELESVSSTPKCFEITKGNFERDAEAASALSEARDASESNERFFLRMESPEDSLSRSGSTAQRGEAEVRSAKSFQRETGKEESEGRRGSEVACTEQTTAE